MKKFSNQNFECIQGLNHMGYAIVFACRQDETINEYKYYYRVLDLDEVDEQNPTDEDHWLESKELIVPDGYRSLGMNLINIETKKALSATSSEFTVITDDSHIYLFRISENNTIYMNRYVLSIADYSINPAWETRYRRSGKTDYPKSNKDTFGYKDMDDNTFLEPTFEFTNIRTATLLQPTIFLTENYSNEEKIWNIVTIASDQRGINFYSIPRAANGLPDLAQKISNSEGNIIPDQTLNLGDYQIQNSISSLLFCRQEKINKDSKEKLQRTLRVMLSCPLLKEQSGNLAVFDLAVANDGSLVTIPNTEIELPINHSPSNMQELFTDDRDLNCCGAILDYVKTEKRVSLLKSCDGDIYLYTKAENIDNSKSLPDFAYTIYSTEASRNILSIATTETDTTVKVISKRNGSQMNDASIAIQIDADNQNCDLNITNKDNTEQWKQLPTNLSVFESILNGEATDNIFSPLLKSQKEVFFDYDGKWELNKVDSIDNAGKKTGSLLLINSVPKAVNENKISCTVSSGSSSELCNLNLFLNFKTDITENWIDLPRDTAKLQETLNGLSKFYNYSNNSNISTPVCRITSGAFFIWFISKKEGAKKSSVEVEKVSQTKCTLTLKTTLQDSTIISEVWPDITRDPDKMVAILSGTGESYDYTKIQRNFESTDSYSDLFTVINTGGSDLVDTQKISGEKSLSNGSILTVAIYYGTGQIENTFTSIIQGVQAATSLSHSMIFNFSTQTQKSNIDGVFITNVVTHESSGEDAVWLSPPDRTSLLFSHSAINIDTQKNLDIEQSLTLEAWIHPEKSGEDQVRIIHHSSDTTTSQYALGLERKAGMDSYSVYGAVRESAAKTFDFPIPEEEWSHVAFSYKTGFSLEFDGANYLTCDNSSSLNQGEALSIEAWVKPQASSTEKRIIVSKYSQITQNKGYQVYIEGGKAVLKFSSSSKHKEYTCTEDLPVLNEWVHIAAVISFEVVSETVSNEVVTNTNIKGSIFVNGICSIPTQETIDGEIIQLNVSPSNLTIGGIKQNNPTYATESHRISEVRIWNRLLSPEEVMGNYQEKRLTGSTENLISYWMLNEGEGSIANDQKKLNPGKISSSKFWRFSRQGADWRFFVNGIPYDVVLMDSTEVGGFYENKTYIGAMGYDEYVQQAVIGELDEIRIWNLSMTQENVLDSMYAELDGLEKGLQGYWQFDQGTGKDIPDKSNHGNNGNFCPVSFDAFSIILTLSDETKLGISLKLDNCTLTQVNSSPIDNSFDFSVMTTASSTLTPYWLIESGYTISIRQNNGTAVCLTNKEPINLIANTNLDIKISVDNQTINTIKYLSRDPKEPVWEDTIVAPVERDLPCCRVIPSDRTYPQNENILNTSCAIEYGEVQLDSNGEMQGVMKRCQAFIDPEGIVYLQNGFKVGEAELKYIGQVQTKPTLIGFIEGAPPVPSENLTVNDRKTDDYVGTSSIQLVENNTDAYLYSGSSDTYLDMSLDTKIGLFYGTETKAGVGVSQEVFKLEGKLGIHMKGETSFGWKSSVEIGSSTTINTKKSLDCCGFWEVKKDYDNSGTPRYLNPEIGQRYVPNNMGYAIVKSGTADLFSMSLRSTGATINYVIKPNQNIPEDWNVIMFPLKPDYIKNGTLDGMVGLESDPDYPSSIHGELGSYFKPVEAYALKQTIDQEKESLKTFFNQISTTPLSAMQSMETPENPLLRKWDDKISSRNIVNSYVWTAQGGFYAEEEQYQDVKKVSHGGIFSVSLKLGIYGSLQLRGGGVGLDVEADILFGPRWETSIVSSEENSNSFGMNVGLTGEGWLNKWNAEAKKYEEFDCPGKVDGYRFMSYYLSPDTNNFGTFFNDVVDQAWLNNSNVPNAIALKQAKNTENSVWRILHRVTFVSRVPPEYKSSPDENPTPSVSKPVNIQFNQWFIDLLNKHLDLSPSRAAIDTAVDTVLDTDLPLLNKYWKTFIEKAQQTPDGDEARQLLDIRNTSKHYFYDYYETKTKEQ